MQLIDGRATAQQIRKEIKEQVAEMVQAGHQPPHLAAVLIGDNPASHTYVRGKMRACEEVGFRSSLIQKDSNISESELLSIIEGLNQDETLDGFIVQLPLPDHIAEEKVTLAIAPEKDVDGFHPWNLGRMMLGMETFVPATPFGIMQLLERYQIETSGKHCVVVGRSNIVGTPISVLMSRKAQPGNCTVTLAHSRTPDLKAETLRADILIAALGKPEFITADMVKEGTVVIDVGTTRIKDSSKKSGFRLAGDVKFDEVAPKCSYITPVPGGVGPMTIVSLLYNTFQSASIRRKQ